MPRNHIKAMPQTTSANATGMPIAIAPINETRKTVTVMARSTVRSSFEAALDLGRRFVFERAGEDRELAFADPARERADQPRQHHQADSDAGEVADAEDPQHRNPGHRRDVRRIDRGLPP